MVAVAPRVRLVLLVMPLINPVTSVMKPCMATVLAEPPVELLPPPPLCERSLKAESGSKHRPDPLRPLLCVKLRFAQGCTNMDQVGYVVNRADCFILR